MYTLNKRIVISNVCCICIKLIFIVNNFSYLKKYFFKYMEAMRSSFNKLLTLDCQLDVRVQISFKIDGQQKSKYFS